MEAHRGQAKSGRPIYDRFAWYYDAILRPLESRFLKRLRARTLSALPAEGRLLEVGAGTGLNFPFYPRAARVAASEPSREMLKKAVVKERPCTVSLVQNFAESLPFPDDSFDAAFATLVFCSVADPARCFLELRRVVRPDGKIFLLEHVRPEGRLLGPIFDALSLFTVALFEDHFNRRTSEEAERAGLLLVRREPLALGVINIIELRNGPKSGVAS
jgi:ubiquinone/menaquinone biosynthesis C-methylase UbiE